MSYDELQKKAEEEEAAEEEALRVNVKFWALTCEHSHIKHRIVLILSFHSALPTTYTQMRIMIIITVGHLHTKLLISGKCA
jgi:hypothetical protein